VKNDYIQISQGHPWRDRWYIGLFSLVSSTAAGFAVAAHHDGDSPSLFKELTSLILSFIYIFQIRYTPVVLPVSFYPITIPLIIAPKHNIA
jgi:hypothetical protein